MLHGAPRSSTPRRLRSQQHGQQWQQQPGPLALPLQGRLLLLRGCNQGHHSQGLQFIRRAATCLTRAAAAA